MSSVLVSPRNGIALARQSELDFECLINGAVVEGCLALGDARNVTSCRLRGAVRSGEHQQNEQSKHFENSTSVRSQSDARSESEHVPCQERGEEFLVDCRQTGNYPERASGKLPATNPRF